MVEEVFGKNFCGVDGGGNDDSSKCGLTSNVSCQIFCQGPNCIFLLPREVFLKKPSQLRMPDDFTDLQIQISISTLSIDLPSEEGQKKAGSPPVGEYERVSRRKGRASVGV